MNAVEQIGLNVLGGVVTVLLIDGLRWLRSRLRHRKLVAVFGQDATTEAGIHLVYTHLILPDVRDPKGEIMRYPYRKPGMEHIGVAFSTSRSVTSAEVRAIKHLAETLGMGSGQATRLSSDYEMKGRLDVSFISIGGPFSNFKTKDALDNDGNKLVNLTEAGFTSRTSGRVILKPEPGYDYGLIMKCRPSQFPQRVWLVCAGSGEWGSSGESWFLAHKWEEIYRRFGAREFAVIAKVKEDQDEYATPVVWLDSKESAEQLANDIEGKAGRQGHLASQ